MMDLGSNNNFEEKAIKNSSPLLIKSAAHRGPAAAPSQRGLQAAEKKGAPAPQKRRRCHQVEWSGPDLYTHVLPPPSSGTSVLATKKHVTPKLCDILMLKNTKNCEKAVPLPFDRRTCVSPYKEGLYVILSLRTVERRRCYRQVISINVFRPRHQLKDAATKLLKIKQQD